MRLVGNSDSPNSQRKMSSDTWNDIEKLRKNQESLRERIQRRRQGHKDILAQTGDFPGQSTQTAEPNECSKEQSSSNELLSPDKPVSTAAGVSSDADDNRKINPRTEKKFQEYLCHHSLEFPIDSLTLTNGFMKMQNGKGDQETLTVAQVELLLKKQAAHQFIEIEENTSQSNGHSSITVTSVFDTKFLAFIRELEDPTPTDKSKSHGSSSKSHSKDSSSRHKQGTKRHVSDSNDKRKHQRSDSRRSEKVTEKKKDVSVGDDIEALLSVKSAKEQDSKRIAEEIQELLGTATIKERKLAEKFRTMGGSQVKEFCPHGTRSECMRQRKSSYSCSKLHFKKLLKPHTDESLGDCSFLNTCFHMDTCKYVHYEIDYKGSEMDPRYKKRKKRSEISEENQLLPKLASDKDYLQRKMLPAQWINCDIRYLDVSVLGKFSVIMADPPWDIHMELPYGTMQDDEMRALRIQDLSDDGLFFLWVTGSYRRCDELIWVKTNQLQRLIRTGRTGHWLNHGKEHCLVGIKGNPKNINTCLDCDVLVAEVRDTSHKPDEVYGIIERLSPGTRKLELFGRMHNVQPNWVTLGNQLDGVHLVESDVVEKFTNKYPDGKVTKPGKPQPGKPQA